MARATPSKLRKAAARVTAAINGSWTRNPFAYTGQTRFDDYRVSGALVGWVRLTPTAGRYRAYSESAHEQRGFSTVSAAKRWIERCEIND